MIRGWLLAGGAIGLTDKQIRAVDTLVTAWRGQGGVAVGSDVARSAPVCGPARRRACVAPRGDLTPPLVVLSSAWHAVHVAAELYPGDIKSVLLTEEQIQARILELGRRSATTIATWPQTPARICC